MNFPVEMRGTRNPVHLWAHEHEVEPAALQQLRNIASMEWVHGVRVMADVHLGKGATVGSVIAMRNAVSPSAVGVDIGCGVVAVKTSLTENDLDNLPALRSAIEATIPVGFRSHERDVNLKKLGLETGMKQFWGRFKDLHPGVQKLETRAHSQLGTLGGGNHFIEVCVDEEGSVWLTLHSGSRNIGKELAERHIEIAKGLSHNDGIVDKDLAVFLAGTPQMDAYRRDLWWAQDFAARSRSVMMALFKEQFARHFAAADVTFGEEMNCFAGETRVLTRHGVQEIKAMAGSEHELLTTGGEWVTAPVESFGQQRLYAVRIGRYGQEKVIRATAGHRWLLRPKVAHSRTEATTTGLRVGDRLEYVFSKRLEGLTLDHKGVARGFIFGDGALGQRGEKSVANFCGEKDHNLLPYFDWHHLDPRTYTYDHGQGEKTYMRMHGFPLEWKVEAPALDEPADVLYGWLAGYFAADGDVGKTGRATIASSDYENLVAVKDICSSLGIATHEIRKRRKNAGAYPGAKEFSYLMGIAREHLSPEFFIVPVHRERHLDGKAAHPRHGWTVREVRETDDYEEVYCAVVEDTHAFALEGNILTGNCHHNYVSEEEIDGETMLVTRKGAIRAGKGDLALIPGSMGTGSYVVRGLGNNASFQSASHGAGRKMSRSAAKRNFTVDDLIAQTAGVESRKDAGVVDEIPGAYKDLHSVMDAQKDLVDVVQHLRTVLCVKG